MDGAIKSSWKLTGCPQEEVTADRSVWPQFPACGLQGLAGPTMNILLTLETVDITGWWARTWALIPGGPW